MASPGGNAVNLKICFGVTRLPPEGKLFIPLIPIIILPFVWVYKEKSSGGVLFAVDFFLQRVEIQRET